MNIRIVFMGSPEFALPTLRIINEHYGVIGVVTQPDKPAGRGRIITPPPVKLLAQELGIPIIQPLKVREPEAMAQLREWAPDVIVVAAFGQILRSELLNLPRLGCINVHASLLPRWRGASPIQAAIYHGDKVTGITIMQMDPGMDTGPIYIQREIMITQEDTGGSLSERLADLGADLLDEVLPDIIEGKIQAYPQDSEKATKAPLLKKEDGLLDFSRSAEELARQVRAYNPFPGAYFLLKGLPLKVHRAHPIPYTHTSPGRHFLYEGYPAIDTVEGALVLDEIQPAGKKPMTGKAFIQGSREWL
jgi:methionyl-tRNA formyltransferase